MLKRPAGASRREANGGVERAERSYGARRARQGRGCGPCARTGKYKNRSKGAGMPGGKRRAEARRMGRDGHGGEGGLHSAEPTGPSGPPPRTARRARHSGPFASHARESEATPEATARGGAPRRAQVPGRVLAAAVRPKRLDLLGTGAKRDVGPLLARNRARRVRRRRRQRLVTPFQSKIQTFGTSSPSLNSESYSAPANGSSPPPFARRRRGKGGFCAFRDQTRS